MFRHIILALAIVAPAMGAQAQTTCAKLAQELKIYGDQFDKADAAANQASRENDEAQLRRAVKLMKIAHENYIEAQAEYNERCSR